MYTYTETCMCVNIYIYIYTHAPFWCTTCKYVRTLCIISVVVICRLVIVIISMIILPTEVCRRGVPNFCSTSGQQQLFLGAGPSESAGEEGFMATLS